MTQLISNSQRLRNYCSCYCLAIAVCLFLLGQSNSARAESSRFLIKPTKCIALHEGQVCYQTLKVIWTAETRDDYCLVSPNRKTPWQCWSATQSAQFEIEFESANTEVFTLVRTRDQKSVGEVIVEVAWVYKAQSRRESHWRLF